MSGNIFCLSEKKFLTSDCFKHITMYKTDTAGLGKRGEDVALKFLKERGMQLVARNWRSSHKKLDLIMEDGNFLRIIEVRSLSYPNNVLPFETVGPVKRRMVVDAARHFVALKGIDKEIVFDIVSIVFNGDLFTIDYIANAFAPRW